MKIMLKTPLALAIAGLVAAPNAYALTTTVPANQPLAENLYNDSNDAFEVTGALVTTVEPADTFLGRTTGFNVQYRLPTATGAVFDAVPNAAACNAALGTTMAAPAVAAPAATGTMDGWSCSIAGGGAGSSVITYSIQPVNNAPGIVAGELLRFAAGAFAIRNVQGSLGKDQGGTVQLDTVLNDPVGGGSLATALQAPIATSVPGVNWTVGAGDGNKRIDVGAPSNKLVFSPNGTIGVPAGTAETFFFAGTIAYAAAGRCDGFTPTGTNANCSAASNFQFDTNAGGGQDTVSVTITGTDLSAFNDGAAGGAGIYIQQGACAAAPTMGAAEAAFAAGNNTTATATTNVVAAAGDAWRVCMIADGNTIIEAQVPTVSASINFADNAITPADDQAAAPLTAMQYNGSVVTIDFINPASNTDQFSVLRLCNTGPVDANVTLSGTDDAGNAAPGGDVTFTQASGTCRQLNADMLENGDSSVTGAWGDGAGKWRSTVTMEGAGLRVFSFARSADGSLSNMSNSSLERNVGPAWDQDGQN